MIRIELQKITVEPLLEIFKLLKVGSQQYFSLIFSREFSKLSEQQFFRAITSSVKPRLRFISILQQISLADLRLKEMLLESKELHQIVIHETERFYQNWPYKSYHGMINIRCLGIQKTVYRVMYTKFCNASYMERELRAAI